MNSILLKLYVLEQEATNKTITDLKTKIQTLEGDVKTLTEEKIEQSEGNQ